MLDVIKLAFNLTRNKQLNTEKTQALVVGKQYEAIVIKLMAFGAFIEVDGQDGLIHISQLAPVRIGQTEDILEVGAIIDVKCIEVDGENIRFTMIDVEQLNEKVANRIHMAVNNGGTERKPSFDRNSRGGRDSRGGRGDRNDRPRRSFGDKPRGDRNDRDNRGDRNDRPRRSFGDKPRGDRNDRDNRGDRNDRPRRSFGDKPRGDRNDRGNRSDKPRSDRPRKSFGDKPRNNSDRPNKRFSK